MDIDIFSSILGQTVQNLKNIDQRGNDPSLGYTLLGRMILFADGR
jgi:hypothetical protein